MLRKLAYGAAGAIVAALVLPPLWFRLFPPTRGELPPPGRRVEVAPGVAVNVIEKGEGRPVVLVHGHPGSAYDWMPLMDALADRGYRALAYDRVGYGRSDGRGDDDYTVAANARELLAVLDAEQLENAVVVGWSYGGATSIVAARRDDSRISRLVLVGSVGPGIEKRGGPPAWVVELVLRPALAWLGQVPPLGRRVRGAITEEAFAPEAIEADYLAQLDANFARPHTLDTFRSEGRDLDGRADLDPAPLDLPILVIHGDGDRLVPRSVGEEIARRAKDSTLWIVPGAGHMLPITRAETLAERIEPFAKQP